MLPLKLYLSYFSPVKLPTVTCIQTPDKAMSCTPVHNIVFNYIFQFTSTDKAALMDSQIATSSLGHKRTLYALKIIIISQFNLIYSLVRHALA